MITNNHAGADSGENSPVSKAKPLSQLLSATSAFDKLTLNRKASNLVDVSEEDNLEDSGQQKSDT